MKSVALLFAILFYFSTPVYGAIGTTFESQISSYTDAQLLEDNDKAFMARLALIDRAPQNGSIRIATFTFDYGDRVKQLSAHLCQASRRGVSVELITDSKSGDQVGRKDPFDKSGENKRNEEIYAYLADCGVDVYIHNHLSDFVTFFGRRLPPIFPGVKPGSSLSIFDILNFVSSIKTRFAGIVKNALGKSIKSDPKNVFDNIHSMYSNVDAMTSLAGKTDTSDHSHVADDIDTRIRLLTDRYKKFFTDPIWTEMNAASMKKVVSAFKTSFKNDADLVNMTKQVRLFNRLNHRKLFMVESADFSSGCAIIGGRNLGDNYLANTAKSFVDGDVLVCRHHKDTNDFFDQALASFELLKGDMSDGVLGETQSNRVRPVDGDPKFHGKFDSFKLKATSLSLGTPLTHFSEPELLRSDWTRPEQDEVRLAFIKSIRSETKEIYIESAYIEFDKEIRDALEQAAHNGIKITIVSNSFFISDGASKLIRLFMRGWVERMQKVYPKNFQVAFATLSGKHMIHFKGAGFLCQKQDGKTFRSYMIGSHNFHQRSGYSDKEHMLQWKEATSDCASPKDDLVALRKAYYAKNKILATYPTFYHELHSVISGSNDKKYEDWARAMMNMMYKFNPKDNSITLLHKDQVDHFQDLFENGDLQDFVGLLL